MNLDKSADKVAGVVVLYNSSDETYYQILTYLNQVEKLYVIDNSFTINQWLWKKLTAHPQVHYEHAGQNLGIATALNKAAIQALEEGFPYLLTMDDDSAAPADMVETLHAFYKANPDARIGIVSPKHVLTVNDHRISNCTSSYYTDVPTLMTSGNLVNLRAYAEVGPFRDDLFIDVVDHEFNLRLRRAAYRLIELQTVFLKHDLGDPKRSFWGLVRFVSHSPVRNYYLIRNSLLVAKANSQAFPEYWLTALLTIAMELVKIVFFESQRLLRLRMAYRGLRDAINGRGGSES